MSKFFGAGSDSETESSASEEEQQQKPSVGLTKTIQWSDDEEDVKRVVRSAKDKRYEEIQTIIKNMKNHKKIKDMHSVLTDFEDLGRAYDKAKKVIEKEGIPRFYVRCLYELDLFVSECWEDRDGRKAMSKNNAKGLTTLRQKLRRYNRDFERELEDYKANPDHGEEVVESEEEDKDEESEDDDTGTGVDFFRKGKAEAPAPAPQDMEESDSDDEFWGDDSETETSTSEDEKGYGGTLTAEYFLKKTPAEGETEKKKKEKKKREKIVIVEDEDEDDEKEGWKQVKGGAVAAEKPKMFAKDAEITHELVFKKLMEIISARGKKATDRSDQIGLLIELRSIANANNLGHPLDCRILFDIVGAIFDYNPNIATCMKVDMWNKCTAHVEELLTLLSEHSNNIICGEHVAEESENFSGEGAFRIRGCILTLVERMDEEYIKMLQACDAHSTEYVDRLKDEITVCRIIENLQHYMEGRGTTEEICRCYLKRIEHIYYKFDHLSQIKKQMDGKKTPEMNGTVEPSEKIEEAKAGEGESEKEGGGEEKEEDAHIETSSRELVDRLCKYIYSKDTTDRIRTRAILCHIYHHAIHDRWFEARDIMLMSHLQDMIQHSDIPTQIMYNRAMVQLGLCAFRQGMIKDAHNCLVDIQSGGRAKELLAQGLLLQRQHERTPEQEKIEKRRQMPYHMHINLEMLECVYLVSAMLIEIPYMAAHEFDARRRMISKNFHHVLRVSERQPLVGPPESMREHVVAASKAMKIGDWKTCRNYIINEKMNAKVWDLFYRVDHVRDMITAKIQEESLRTYLFTYSSIYDSLSMDTLAEMFELDRSIVHSTISKMIISEELKASLDEPTQSVVMHRTEPTALQSMCLQLSEKVASLVEHNERMMEVKSGGTGFFQRQDRQGYDNRDRGQQGGYGDKRRYGDKSGGGYGERRNYGDKSGGYGSKNYGEGGYRSRGQRQHRY